MADRIFDTLVIGGGQTGLTVGYQLAKTGRTFVILDASERVGDAWRKRWDSLVLFTPVGLNEIPELNLPGSDDHFITKDEMADALEDYARDQGLPVLGGVEVERLSKEGDIFVAETTAGTFRARNVVVAMANIQRPKVPDFAHELDPAITQLHSAEYQSPASLGEGSVLVVGMGNSGADIGLELAKARDETYIAGAPSGVIPFRIEGWFARVIGISIVRFFTTKVLTTSTPIGRKARPKMLVRAQPVVRVKPRDLEAAGAERVPRVTGVRDGQPLLEDGRTLDVENVLWCTGFDGGFDWIDLPVLEDNGYPRHSRGVVEDVPGLYFCGLTFQHALWSETIVAMPDDARYVVDHLDGRQSEDLNTLAGAEKSG